eukprot:CAMPEP_0197583194 /NCGR_PEP_ID=MMETSP1326-20131121/6188_1 /TAXON_ID=1155430 /ORGANISM="Genus nov. species nov., Strain RCC2288" /LENGTH=828 /DNA_ID=CAMNT_0043147379 /DNA_START=88 /DNA_END=2570 /DNA_ORIENTATION=+
MASPTPFDGTPCNNDMHWKDAVVSRGSGGKTLGSLTGLAPSPMTPAYDAMCTPVSSRARSTPQHVPGDTPELRGELPSRSLTQWSDADVATCLRVLGREFAREQGTNSAREVGAFDKYADAFLAKRIDGAKFAAISIKQLSQDLGVSNYNHRLKIVSWIKTYLEDKVICPALRSMPDSPEGQNRECESPDAKDRAISILSCKLHDMQSVLVDLQSKQIALEEKSTRSGHTPPRQSPSVQPPVDEALTIALAQANARALQNNEDATEAHEAMMKAVDENEKLAAALERYDKVLPEMKTSNDKLREETVVTLQRLQSEFVDALATAEARACETVASLERENVFQTLRNGKLHARNRQLYNQIQDLKGAIRVYTRIRPVAASDDGPGAVVVPGRCLDPAAEGMDVVCTPPPGKLSATGERRPAGKRADEKRFSFDKVFGPDSTQGQVYEELSPLVCGILDGYNVCIFAYGQTGSGKTFTMGGPGDGTGRGSGDGKGSCWGFDETAGVNTRALTELFESAASRASANDGAASFTISVEMREIYNEHVRDLLNMTEKEDTWNGVAMTPRFDKAAAATGGSSSSSVRPGSSSARPGTASAGAGASGRDKGSSGGNSGSSGSGGVAEGASGASGEEAPVVTRVVALNAAHVLEIMAEGTTRRACGGTALNERSSRSHSVVTVYVEGTNVATGRVVNGRLHLIDLAGSERVGRSEATGDRLKEAQHINKSLSALGDVIAALLEKRAHVPYRNSQLTRLLSDSLGGNSKVVLLAHLAPESASLPETQSTLLFSQRCSQVELGKAKINAMAAPAGGGGASEAALAAIAKYKGELEVTR